MSIIPIHSSPRHIAVEQVEERGLFMAKEAINLGDGGATLQRVLKQLAKSRNSAIASEAMRLMGGAS